jgi:hypothetical protein
VHVLRSLLLLLCWHAWLEIWYFEKSLLLSTARRAGLSWSKLHRSPPCSTVRFPSSMRGDSTHLEERTINIASELQRGLLRKDPGAETLGSTRRAIEHGWRAVSTLLEANGERELARHIRQFVNQIPPAQTDREWVATKLIDGIHQKRRERSQPTR